MTEPGTTAVVAVVPAAEPLLRRASEVDARVVRPGVPAHATLLYPWLPADRVGAPELDRLRHALPGDPVRIRLAEVERQDGFVAVPVPELAATAHAVRRAFPDQPPYGGRFGPNPPVHLTVALNADPAVAAEVAREIAPRLPVTAEIATVHVVALGRSGWRVLAELPLAAGPKGSDGPSSPSGQGSSGRE
ncbi:2'-5' RNA ligase family protein [Streptomyces sp. VRA16 Mangrove soil]|uniref:2'-5' RNA ligase family protein n=1 Tax=Streptomyces sp. VRA16 Mangrove soil TaxID=2817434 RepID=UPI001A9F0B28|nr:2'-5' RNA ligase family protein [Streptomyces sp. VRA16 Mangrove soil]MBO1330276.1 2'-5' RNA ligase family protein [Streptomyces sp. VRA16 Mangrove soil]